MLFIQHQRSTGLRRRVLLLLAGIFAAVNLQAQAQEPSISFAKPVATLEEALKEIEAQTGYRISTNHTNFDVTRKVNLPSAPIGLEEALKHLLYGSNRTYMIRGTHILIVPDFGVPVIIPTHKPALEITLSDTPEKRGRSLNELSGVIADKGVSLIDRTGLRNGNVRLSSHRETARGINSIINPEKPLPSMAVKINLLYGGAALAPNLGFEIGLTRRSTLDVRGSYNQWGLEGTWDDNKKTAHWIVSAEYRHWFCERFNGHFVGVHGFYGYYNISQREIPLLLEKGSDKYRYHGDIVGAGISYGYQWILGKRWNLEAQIGAGYGRMKYDRFDCPRCGDTLEKGITRNYFGPTRAGITLIYIIK